MLLLPQINSDNSKSIHNTIAEDDFIIIIKKVNSKQLLKEFYQVPFKIYKENKQWVPAFWKEVCISS